jgi:putative ABC transport system permease protein
MFLTKLAIKNLFRHKKRTIVTALVITFGIFLFLVSDSLMVGLRDISLENHLNLQTSHLQVMDTNYWEEKDEFPLENLINVDKQLENNLKSNKNILQTTPRLYFTATVNNGQEEYPITAVGIRPETDSEVINLKDYILKGEMIQKGNTAILGKALADLMGFEVSDNITLLFKTKEGTFNTIGAELTGILDTPNPQINEYQIFMPLSLVQDSLQLDNKASKYLVKLDNREQALSITNNLNQQFEKQSGNLRAYNWEKLSQGILAMMRQGDIENLIMLLIIIVLAAVGVINTIILSALERLEEIGMMKALGLKVREIVYIFVVESACIGAIGSFFGIIFGGVGVYFLKNIGIDVATMTGGETTFGMPIAGKVYGGWNPDAFLFIFFFGIIVSILASILPASWGAKKDPVKAIYHK